MKPFLVTWAVVATAGLLAATFVAPPAHWAGMIAWRLGW